MFATVMRRAQWVISPLVAIGTQLVRTWRGGLHYFPKFQPEHPGHVREFYRMTRGLLNCVPNFQRIRVKAGHGRKF